MEEFATGNGNAIAGSVMAGNRVQLVLPGGVMRSPGGGFATWSCSPACGLALGPALLPDAGYLAINGTTDLSGLIQGPGGGAKVSSIRVIANRQYKFYQYAIVVYGQGAVDAAPGNSLGLVFTDQTGETHGLMLRAAEPQWHFVQYNARHPGIIQVQWSSGGDLNGAAPGAAGRYP